MSDKFSPEKRSDIMSRITGKDTRPEITVRKYLFTHGFRYRKNVEKLPGKPDIVLPKYKTIVFVNGCFWHGHKDCKKAVLPTTNFNFWKEKIDKNKERDKNNIAQLEKKGYHVIVIWQCELTAKNKEQTLNNLKNQIYQSFIK